MRRRRRLKSVIKEKEGEERWRRGKGGERVCEKREKLNNGGRG